MGTWIFVQNLLRTRTNLHNLRFSTVSKTLKRRQKRRKIQIIKQRIFQVNLWSFFFFIRNDDVRVRFVLFYTFPVRTLELLYLFTGEVAEEDSFCLPEQKRRFLKFSPSSTPYFLVFLQSPVFFVLFCFSSSRSQTRRDALCTTTIIRGMAQQK